MLSGVDMGVYQAVRVIAARNITSLRVSDKDVTALDDGGPVCMLVRWKSLNKAGNLTACSETLASEL